MNLALSPAGMLRLQGSSDEPLYRAREGDHRVFYLIEDARLLVGVVKVGHRSSVYN